LFLYPLTNPFPSITSGNEGRPALDISQQIETVRTLRVDIASKEITISKSQSFHQERPNHPKALCDIADAVLGCLKFEPSSLVSIRTWFFAETTFTKAWWQTLMCLEKLLYPLRCLVSYICNLEMILTREDLRSEMSFTPYL
jgi:hypothetical protein